MTIDEFYGEDDTCPFPPLTVPRVRVDDTPTPLHLIKLVRIELLNTIRKLLTLIESATNVEGDDDEIYRHAARVRELMRRAT